MPTTTDKATKPTPPPPAPELTRGERMNVEISALLRARNTLLWIVTREEQRVERAITEAAASAKYVTLFWDCSTGVSEASGKGRTQNGDPAGVLAMIRDSKERAVYVLRDFHKWSDPVTMRALKSRARELKSASPNEARSIVVLSSSNEVPPELAAVARVIEYPIPDRVEMGRILDDLIGSVREDVRATALAAGSRDAAIDAALGLTAEEAESCYSHSLVTLKRIDPALVAAEKKRVVTREKVLTWYDPDPRGLDAVGGLDALKAWLVSRRAALSERARAYRLPAPRGVFLAGLPGCGKSLTAKCVAAAWGVPLLRLDLGALRSKYVGESEANIRKALSVAETVSPCVLWLDEIEKALAGSTGEQGDGGVSADALGAVLSWMQERQGSVFVVATANDVRALPPELLRKGRFDEVFWVDLPTKAERAEVLCSALAEHGRSAKGIDLAKLAAVTEGFTGAELAALVPDALFASFADGERDLTTKDLIAAARTVVPLAETAKEKVDALRAWAKGRARPASTPEKTNGSGVGRTLDL